MAVVGLSSASGNQFPYLCCSFPASLAENAGFKAFSAQPVKVSYVNYCWVEQDEKINGERGGVGEGRKRERVEWDGGDVIKRGRGGPVSFLFFSFCPCLDLYLLSKFSYRKTIALVEWLGWGNKELCTCECA